MDKNKKLDLKKLDLLYNAAAHLKTVEKYPDGVVGAMSQPGAEGLKALCWAVAELSTRGELVRRMQGYDREETWTAEEIEAVITPYQMMEAKGLVMQAVLHGMKPPEDEHAEVDEVLAELEKKTANG